MTPPLACPTCSEDLVPTEDDSFYCREDHHYTVIGLALTTNISALRALWMAIRALEDDAASLTYLATHYGDRFGALGEARRTEASEALAAAEVLRVHARRAQQRLDALPVAPSAVSEAGSQRGRGG